MQKQLSYFSCFLIIMLFFLPSPAFAMHITEGIITGVSAIIYTLIGLGLVGVGILRMKRFVNKFPEKKPLLGMGGALIFFISLIPIPAFTGTCSHPCGTPLVAILLGPFIGIALTGVSLLLQAAFFAHGGFGTWGANVLDLGFFGCLFGWGTFHLTRKMGMPLWAAGFAAGFIGNIMVYMAAGMILGTTLAFGPNPQYSLTGYLSAIYTAYVPTQLPIAVGEMFVTGLALHYAFKQRPEVLDELGVIKTDRVVSKAATSAMIILTALGLSFFVLTQRSLAEENLKNEKISTTTSTLAVEEEPEEEGLFSGMDEAVNERFAEESGLPPRDPYINLEAMGDLWNMMMMLAGGVCGFIIGRWWHLLWGHPKSIQADAPKTT